MNHGSHFIEYIGFHFLNFSNYFDVMYSYKFIINALYGVSIK